MGIEVMQDGGSAGRAVIYLHWPGKIGLQIFASIGRGHDGHGQLLGGIYVEEKMIGRYVGTVEGDDKIDRMSPIERAGQRVG